MVQLPDVKSPSSHCTGWDWRSNATVGFWVSTVKLPHVASVAAGVPSAEIASSTGVVGAPIGVLLSSGAFALVTQLPEDAFLHWGWRLPFLASALLIAVGIFIRTRIDESPDSDFYGSEASVWGRSWKQISF